MRDEDRNVAIKPGSPEWLQIITPSKVAAIIGESRFESPFGLWHKMRGNIEPEPPKRAFQIGHAAEPFAANLWREEPQAAGWLLSPGEVQLTVPAEHFGFPAAVTLDRHEVRGSWRRVLEFKVARDLTDLERFGDDLTGECPEDFATQVAVQMLFAAAAKPRGRWLSHPGHLLVIGPYFNHRVYDIVHDAGVASWLIGECARFWESLAADTPPPLDDKPQTYETLRKLHPDIDETPEGREIELVPAEAIAYLEAVANEKRAKEAALQAKNVMADRMKRAKYAVVRDPSDPDGEPLRIADRRPTGKGGVSLYAGKTSLIDDVRHLGGTNP